MVFITSRYSFGYKFGYDSWCVCVLFVIKYWILKNWCDYYVVEMRLFHKFEPTAANLEIKGFVELVELIFFIFLFFAILKQI